MKSICPSCSQHIEYDSAYGGTLMTCPHTPGIPQQPKPPAMTELDAYTTLKRTLPSASFCISKHIWRHVYDQTGCIETEWRIWVNHGTGNGISCTSHTLADAVAKTVAAIESGIDNDRELQETTPC